MATSIDLQPITIETSSADTDGRLVLVDGQLVAVLVRLGDESHGEDLQGTWFVECAFGALSKFSGRAIFATLEEAADRMCELLNRAGELMLL
jgi:hypothetical protein